MSHWLLRILAALLLSGAALPAQQEFPDIKNFLRVEKDICTGGQPGMADLERMKEQGVKAILNLRRAEEYDLEAEVAKAKEMGLAYFHIPVNGAEPKDEQVAEFLKITADPRNRPLFIHCTSANRVGAFWMIRRMLVDHWTAEKAEEEAVKVGMRVPALKTFALDYVARHPAASAPDLSTIRNYRRISEQVSTAGQPTVEELEKVKAAGFKTVINFRQPAEYDAAAEGAKLKELGLRYIHIPVVYREPKDEQADEFLKVMADPQIYPVFIHCTVSLRVGMMWAIRRVLVDGWKYEAAEAEALQMNEHYAHAPHLREFALSYIARNKKKADEQK